MSRILTVGHCDFDHGNLSRMLEAGFTAQVDRAHGLDDARAALQTRGYDLVLLNRILDRDGAEGLRVLAALKSDAATRDVPVMLISNYPDAQSAAVAAGAVPGFGKAELHAPAALDRIRAALDESAEGRKRS
ncbi:MAG: hypothetical protein FLDDKLPJ_00229 [Phycisphaerae bacterium]|nr:hypothetical protein [Phycisphaerae bacterium]